MRGNAIFKGMIGVRLLLRTSSLFFFGRLAFKSKRRVDGAQSVDRQFPSHQGGDFNIARRDHLNVNTAFKQGVEHLLSDARLLRAKTLLKMSDVKGASEDVVWLLEHTEADEDVLLMAARVAHLSGKDDTALDIYNKVIDLNPFQMDAYRERGQIRYEQGDKKGAEEDMQKLLEMNPNELADVSGDYSAEGVEQAMKRVYSAINPFGL